MSMSELTQRMPVTTHYEDTPSTSATKNSSASTVDTTSTKDQSNDCLPSPPIELKVKMSGHDTMINGEVKVMKPPVSEKPMGFKPTSTVIQSELPSTPGSAPIHPNAKSTTHINNNGTTTTKTNITSPICKNCKTQTTPLWRRDETGQVLCNACGLFLKLHGRPRPISLKTDTIKSRNRIKQNSGNSTPIKTSPNTPELKSKDKSAKKNSPKLSKKKSIDIPLTPLLPNGNGISQIKPFQHPILHHHHPHHPQHLPHLPHVVQPLHYPSSTPTQFAPGLQRITSPLLLSTTNSLSNTRSEKLQAATTLENMSQELGPSASFKKNGMNNMTMSGVSLIRKDNNTTNSINSSIFASVDVNSPKLSDNNSTNLPPLNQSMNKLPGMFYDIHGQQNLSNQTPPQHQQQPQQTSQSPNQQQNHQNHQQNHQNQQNQHHNQHQQQQQPPNQPPHQNQPQSHEITLLKTRISELELVNDLYRTRIMELEAMEQAARLREQSMKRRLDEMHQFNDLHKLSNQPHPPTLPSIRNVTPPPGSNNIVLPSLKREHDDNDDGLNKKSKY